MVVLGKELLDTLEAVCMVMREDLVPEQLSEESSDGFGRCTPFKVYRQLSARCTP